MLIVQAPPRHGKSQHIARWTPTWYLGHHPHHRVILATYAASLSKTHGRFVRDRLSQFGPWFPSWTGLRADVASQTEWETSHGGGMVAAGVGGPLTGRGANLLIIDDPVKNAEEAISSRVREAHWDWFHSTAFTRLEPGGKVVIIMTRWHQEDLVGMLVQKAQDELGMAVRVLDLPAISEPDDELGRAPGEALWPERWSLESLEAKRAAMPLYWFLALYQQRPTQWGRMEWPDSYFDGSIWISERDWPDRFSSSVVACDPSKGKSGPRQGDFAAHVFLGLNGGKLYVDSRIGRWPTTPLLEKLIDLWLLRGGDRVGIEANAYQDLLANELHRLQASRQDVPPIPVSMITNTTDKTIRIQRLGPLLHRKAFRFLDTPDNRLLVSQLKEFPLGKYDDGPDALEMARRLLNHICGAKR